MITEFQKKLADELHCSLKNDTRFDWVEKVTDYLEPNLLIRERIFVKFHYIEKNIFWAVYVRKNFCEVYQTTLLGWTAGRSHGKKVKMLRGKTRKPTEAIILDILRLMMLEAMATQKRIELYAGDCPTEDARSILESDMHYTVCHYFKCKSCGKYAFIGACTRGTPIFKILDTLENENLDNLIWGKVGIFYK